MRTFGRGIVTVLRFLWRERWFLFAVAVLVVLVLRLSGYWHDPGRFTPVRLEDLGR